MDTVLKIAVYGAVLSTLNAIVHIFNYRRDRANIKITIKGKNAGLYHIMFTGTKKEVASPLDKFKQYEDVLSLLTVVIIFVPCGLKAILLISPSCPERMPIQAPVFTLYTRAVESALAVTNRVPVALKQISNTSSTCPSNVSTHLPEETSHILHVRSIEPF